MSQLLRIPGLIEVLVFVAVATAMMALATLIGRQKRESDRFYSLFKRDGNPVDVDRRLLEIKGGRLAKHLLSSPFPELARRLLSDDDAGRTRLHRRLIAAGIYSTQAPAIYCSVKLLLMVCPGVIGLVCGLLAPAHLWRYMLFGSMTSCAGMLVPALWLDRRKSSRQRTLRKSLPDFLDLSVACLEGGVGVQAAMKLVSDELRSAHPVLAREMGFVQREIELGGALHTAIANLADRTDLEDLRKLDSFVQQSQRFGTTLAGAIRELSEMQRIQREFQAEERAHKAAVKILLPMLLFIFPAVFVVLVGPAAIQLQDAFRVKLRPVPNAPASPPRAGALR
jgi:tight adherence protein C